MGITWVLMQASGIVPTVALTMGVKANTPIGGMTIQLTPNTNQSYSIVNVGTGILVITDLQNNLLYQLLPQSPPQTVTLAFDTPAGSEWLVVGGN